MLKLIQNINKLIINKRLCLQYYKYKSDQSESEDTPHQLPHNYCNPHQQQQQSPTSSPTLLSNRFPLNIDKAKGTPLKLVKTKSPLKRQMSIQSYTSAVSRFRGSNLSLAADDSIDETMRNMLALEDMRGEPQGNRFSRGLRNLRSVGQNVLAKRNISGSLRSKDSVDEESSDLDLDSLHSSSWSIVGSDSADIPQKRRTKIGLRRKKFRRKAASEGMMATMLIRSVHTGILPLDSVKVGS